jgi:hypothetical protein
MIKNLHAVIFLLILMAHCQADDHSKSFLSPLGLHLDYGLKGDYWFTSDDDDSEEGVGHAFDYVPEFIPVQAAQGELLWNGSTWYSFDYENAFTKDKGKQAALLEVTDKESFIEKITTFLDPFFLFGPSDNSVLKFLSRLRFYYKHHVFFGKAKVQENTNYVTANDQTTALETGDEIRFKSDFEEFSVNLLFSKNFWIGIYHNTTVKPHEASTQVTQVLETKITGTGIKFLRDWDTFTLDANIGAVKFRANQGNFRSDGFETLLHCEWRPHIYLIGSADSETSSRHKLVIIPLMGFQFSMQIGSEAQGQASDGTGELSMDIIIDGGLRLQYQF